MGDRLGIKRKTECKIPRVTSEQIEPAVFFAVLTKGGQVLEELKDNGQNVAFGFI